MVATKSTLIETILSCSCFSASHHINNRIPRQSGWIYFIFALRLAEIMHKCAEMSNASER